MGRDRKRLCRHKFHADNDNAAYAQCRVICYGLRDASCELLAASCEVSPSNHRQADHLQRLPCSADSSIVSKRCTRSLTLIIHLAIYTIVHHPHHITLPCTRWCRPSNGVLTYIWPSMKREQMWPTKQRIFNAIE